MSVILLDRFARENKMGTNTMQLVRTAVTTAGCATAHAHTPPGPSPRAQEPALTPSGTLRLVRSGWVARAAQADKVDKVYKDIQKAIDEEKVELAKKKTQEAPPPPPPAVCPPRSRAVRRTQSRGWHLQERHGVRGLGWDGPRAALLCPPTLSEPRAEPSDVCARQVFISKQMGVKPLKKAVASKKNNVKRWAGRGAGEVRCVADCARTRSARRVWRGRRCGRDRRAFSDILPLLCLFLRSTAAG